MDTEVKAAWLAALRSGDYEQGWGRLKYRRPDNEITRHCCLGVLCELAEKAGVVTSEWSEWGTVSYHTPDVKGDVQEAVLPRAVQVWAGLSICDPGVPFHYDGGKSSLSYVNDCTNSGFPEIASLIEEHL